MSSKVFVGNLAFRTTDQALQEAFSKCGEVKSGVIITRGRRSLGYGFVEFATTEQAVAAVEKMNRAEIFGRQVKVELAKDPAERPPPSEGSGGEPGPARRRKRAHEGETASTTTTTTTSTGSSDTSAPIETEARRRRGKKPRNDDASAEPSTTAVGNAGPRSPPEKPKEKVPSKTTLFVANLPFSIDDEQLSKVFADTKLKAAHVVRTRTGRSRGYGFVEFENEADQTEALRICNGKEVVGTNGNRNISVTISNSVGSSTQPATEGEKV